MNNSDLTLLAIRYLVRFFFRTILGVSIFAWLLSCHYDFWVSFFIGLGIGTFSFLLGWNFWGLCLAGVLYMFGAVHFATLVLLLVVLSIACKMVTGGVKGAVIDAIRESKKDESSTPVPPPQPPPLAPRPKKEEPVSVGLAAALLKTTRILDLPKAREVFRYVQSEITEVARAVVQNSQSLGQAACLVLRVTALHPPDVQLGFALEWSWLNPVRTSSKPLIC